MVPFRGTREGGSLIPSRVSGAPRSLRAGQRENNEIMHLVTLSAYVTYYLKLYQDRGNAGTVYKCGILK